MTANTANEWLNSEGKPFTTMTAASTVARCDDLGGIPRREHLTLTDPGSGITQVISGTPAQLMTLAWQIVHAVDNPDMGPEF